MSEELICRCKVRRLYL